MNLNIKKVVIIAPHPDDETIALGGTIRKFIKKNIKVSILVVSGHMPPIYSEKNYETTIREAKNVFKYFGVKDYEFLNLPATKINEIPISEINGKISDFIKKRKPDTVFVPFPDRHIDHRIVFDSCIVAARPTNKIFPKIVLLYETLSETHWNVPGVEPSFNPDFFIEINNELKDKLSALKMYKSQINDKTPYRSVKAVESLANFRGSQNGCKYAEAFKVVRIVI